MRLKAIFLTGLIIAGCATAGLAGSYKLSSNAIPNGIDLRISHGVEYTETAISSAGAQREDGFNYLNYTFTFSNGRQVYARNYVDNMDEVAILECADPREARVKFVKDCQNWAELKQAILSLYALDYPAIVTLTDTGYEPLAMASYGLTRADITEWKTAMNAANR